MVDAAVEGLFLIALLLVAGVAVVRAYSNPHGAYLRIIIWSIGASGAALLLIAIVSMFSNSAAGLGLAFIFAALLVTIGVIAGLAVIAATAGLIRNRLR
jgi:hypothetical protein